MGISWPSSPPIANADAVDNPEKNVPKAVLGGTLGVAVIYIVSPNMIFGIVPCK